MSVYLEEHPPKRRQFYYKRQGPVSGAIVVHTAECAMDISGPDMAAESVARFISTRSDAGSYHSVVDSDSIVRVCKYEWESWHEGTGGNRWSLGLSFACRAAEWATAPAWWLEGTLSNGALEAYNMALWVKETIGKDVPAKRISVEDYRDGLPGFIAHAQLDPTRRSDPGKDFPWVVFLDKYRRLTEVTDTTKLAQLEAFVGIDWAYRSWLGRTPNENELAYWLSQAEKDGLEAVKDSIKNSSEAHGR